MKKSIEMLLEEKISEIEKIAYGCTKYKVKDIEIVEDDIQIILYEHLNDSEEEKLYLSFENHGYGKRHIFMFDYSIFTFELETDTEYRMYTISIDV